MVCGKIKQDKVCTVNKYPVFILFSCKVIATFFASLTSLIQEMKEATRVKTVGLWGVLQPRPSTKLVTPCTYHLPSLPLQFNGPPESPCKVVGDTEGSGNWDCLLDACKPWVAWWFLTWHADLLSPPAHTMVVFAELPHQSL